VSSTVYWTGAAEYATLSNVFTVAGTPTDPTAVSLTVTDPQGAVTTYTYPATVTRTGTGAYQVLQPCSTIDGLWQYVWIGTGTASDIAQGTWTVLPVTAGQWYTSAEELKSRMGITDSGDDFEIQLAVQAAARGVEGFCGRYFWRAADTRTYVPDSIWVQHIDDCVSVTTLKTDPNGDGTFPVTWTAGVDFELAVGERSYNTMASGEPRPYREIRVIGGGSKFFPFTWPLYRLDRVQVTGVFGWPAVPAMVKQASLQLAVDFFKLKDAPFGIAGFGEFGMVKVQSGSQLALQLQPYVDPRRKVGV
jgi:hypothetical protein